MRNRPLQSCLGSTSAGEGHGGNHSVRSTLPSITAVFVLNPIFAGAVSTSPKSSSSAGQEGELSSSQQGMANTHLSLRNHGKMFQTKDSTNIK